MTLNVGSTPSQVAILTTAERQSFVFVGARWVGARRFARIIDACEIFNEKNSKLAKSFDSRKL